jgi:hypothetical protein
MVSTIKTKVTDASVEEFINSVESDAKKQDSFTLLEIYKRATGEEPKMWGAAIIGFGEYHYKSERSSQEGDWPLAAFSPRKQNLTLYVMSELGDYSKLMEKLGKHKTSVACVYINKLSDVDIDILEQLVKQSYLDSKKALT